MATAADKIVKKTSLDTFPDTESIILPLAIFVEIQNSKFSPNSVSISLVDSGDTVVIAPGEKKPFNATSNAILGEFIITFFGPAEVDINYTDGDSAVPAGGATAANQVIIIDILDGDTTSVFSGNSETTSLVEHVLNGSTDICISFSIKFYGTGGSLDGVTVESGFTASYSASSRNELSAIAFVRPTAPDFLGFQRVVISYTKK